MSDIRGIVIPASDDEPIRGVTFDPNDTDFISQIVGGWFAVSDTTEPSITFWFDDEGKIKAYKSNTRATLYWWSCDFRRFNGDFLVGDVLLTGRSDEDGEITSLPRTFSTCFSRPRRTKPSSWPRVRQAMPPIPSGSTTGTTRWCMAHSSHVAGSWWSPSGWLLREKKPRS